MRAIHVRIGHDDDLVIAGPRNVELFLDSRPDRRDDRADLFVRQHLVDTSLLNIDDLAPQRQNGLKLALAPLFRRAAGRVTLDEIELAQLGIGQAAVGELPRQIADVERGFLSR